MGHLQCGAVVQAAWKAEQLLEPPTILAVAMSKGWQPDRSSLKRTRTPTTKSKRIKSLTQQEESEIAGELASKHS